MVIDLLRMAQAPDRDEDPDAVTERILDAALGQFEDFGLRRSTMDNIALRRGLSRITIYRRFPKKENLIEAVVLRELRNFLGDLGSVGGACATPEDRMIERVAFALQYLRSADSLLCLLLRTEPEAILPSLTVNGGAVVDLAREHSAALIRQDSSQQAARRGRAAHPDRRRAWRPHPRLPLHILTPSSAIPMDTLDTPGPSPCI